MVGAIRQSKDSRTSRHSGMSYGCENPKMCRCHLALLRERSDCELDFDFWRKERASDSSFHRKEHGALPIENGKEDHRVEHLPHWTEDARAHFDKSKRLWKEN